MTAEEKTDLMRYMLTEWKATMKERMALKALLNILAEQNPQFDLQTMLKTVRGSASVQERLDAHFAGFEELLAKSGDGTLDEMIRLLAERDIQSGNVH